MAMVLEVESVEVVYLTVSECNVASLKEKRVQLVGLLSTLYWGHYEIVGGVG